MQGFHVSIHSLELVMPLVFPIIILMFVHGNLAMSEGGHACVRMTLTQSIHDCYDIGILLALYACTIHACGYTTGYGIGVTTKHHPLYYPFSLRSFSRFFAASPPFMSSCVSLPSFAPKISSHGNS